MCELAIVDVERLGVVETVESVMEIYRSQRHALGLTALFDEGDHFEYEHRRWVDNGVVSEVTDFVKTHGEDADRLFVHGRLATSGERDINGAHPIELDCPECGVDFIMHNGVFTRHRQHLGGLRDHGHEFETNVDTETIAHMFADVPESFDEVREFYAENPSIRTQMGIILGNEDRVFVHVGRYNTNENIEMCRSHRHGLIENDDSPRTNYLLLRPGTFTENEVRLTTV